MSKIPKKTTKKLKRKKIPDEKLVLRTVRIAAILAGLFLVLSLLFNGTEYFFEGITTNYFEGDFIIERNYWDVIDYSIKVIVIVFEFFFMMISIGNYKELTGKPVKIQEILVLLGICLVQTIRSLVILAFVSIGLSVILFYLFMIQES